MAVKWTWLDPNDPARKVELDYNYWTGGKKLNVDGREVPTQAKMLSWSHELTLGSHPAIVRSKLRYLLLAEAELEVGGVTVPPATAPRPVPPWAWAFALANVAILVASLGGALPGAIAGVGAVSAIAIARSALSLVPRLLLCAAITGAAWGLFGLLVSVTR